MGTREQYGKAKEELERACIEAGRPAGSVKLVAVSKTVGPEEVAQAIEGGARDFGENRPDELVKKASAFGDVSWHFIGNIQSRRIKDIVGRAALIHSLFELRHAKKIDECARALGIVQDVLLEVNVSGEASKSGCAPDEAKGFIDACGELGNVRVCGLMTMAPQGDRDSAREAFRGLARLMGDLRAELDPPRAAAFAELSMGMSEDWRIAVEEGATIVRIGRAIFSETF